MIQEIRFGGHTVVPSDYDTPDGTLSLPLNLIPEDGALRPILPPEKIKNIAPYECLCIHNVGASRRYILYSPSSRSLLQLPEDAAPEESTTLADGFTARPAVAIMGNTLIASDGLHTAYILYSHEKAKYILLGPSIPEISIDFALAHNLDVAPSYSDTLTLGIPEGVSKEMIAQVLPVFNIPGNTANHATPLDSFLTSISNSVLGFLNRLNADTAQAGKFIHPFLLRWAYRLYDGSYTHQSAPILLIPNSAMPPLKYDVSTSEDSLLKIHLETILRRCTLLFRPSGLEALSKWTDIIHSIDFFITRPIYTYDQAGSIERAGRTSDDVDAIISHCGAASSVTRAAAGDNYHRHSASLSSASLPMYAFPDGCSESRLSSTGSNYLMPPRFSREHIESEVTAAAVFHLIASLPLTGEDAISDLPNFTPLDINDSALSTISTRPTLPDDWRSHDTIHFRLAYPYNSRLTLSAISSSLFPGFPIPDMTPWYSGSGSDLSPCRVWIKTVRESRPYWVSVDSVIHPDYLPRFLYYPDPSAVEMRIILSDSSGWRLPLRRHDFLNGAYFFDGLDSQRTSKEEAVEVPVAPAPSLADEPGKILLSEVSNPFLFPVTYRVTIEDAEIKGIASAAKALSQGQFGQYPLYAFTDKGIWALEVSSTGTYSARQPITRDVCIGPESITQIDSAVLFASDRGIMLLSGSHTECLSESINTDYPFSLLSLPGFPKLYALGPGQSDSPISLLPFSAFLRDCRMIYDYTHQRIIAYNPAAPYAYVYSIRSRAWGMILTRLSSHFPSYPEALALDKDHNIISFSQSSSPFPQAASPAPDIQKNSLLLSRPLKLGAPDILKTVDTLILRGQFRRGHVATALYGSRDLIHWHLIWSSKDHTLQAFRGTPWKYFRIAAVAMLAPSESISGATIQFTPRLTNHPR